MATSSHLLIRVLGTSEPKHFAIGKEEEKKEEASNTS